MDISLETLEEVADTLEKFGFMARDKHMHDASFTLITLALCTRIVVKNGRES